MRRDAGTSRNSVEASFDHPSETRFSLGLREWPLVLFRSLVRLPTTLCGPHDNLSGEIVRLRLNAGFQTAMPVALPSIAGEPVQRNAASQASESVVEAVSDLLLTSIIVLAVLSQVRVSE